MTHRPASTALNPSADAAWRARYGGEPCQLVGYWPIVDDDLTRSQLLVAGRAILAEHADHHELVVTEATWHIEGDRLRLDAAVIAWPPADWDGSPIVYQDPEEPAA
jgi:hypothetical protein